MNKRLIAICAMAATIIVCTLYVGHRRSQVKYVDVPCPTCGSCEVLDFGHNDQGEQRAHCYDCKQDFTISETTLHDATVCR